MYLIFFPSAKENFLTESITEQLLHSEFDYSNNSVIFNRELDC